MVRSNPKTREDRLSLWASDPSRHGILRVRDGKVDVVSGLGQKILKHILRFSSFQETEIHRAVEGDAWAKANLFFLNRINAQAVQAQISYQPSPLRDYLKEAAGDIGLAGKDVLDICESARSGNLEAQSQVMGALHYQGATWEPGMINTLYVKLLAARDKSFLTIKNAQGELPLMEAAREGRAEEVEALLALYGRELPDQLMLHALREGMREGVLSLLASHGNACRYGLYFKDSAGFTVVDYATRWHDFELIRLCRQNTGPALSTKKPTNMDTGAYRF